MLILCEPRPLPVTDRDPLPRRSQPKLLLSTSRAFPPVAARMRNTLARLMLKASFAPLVTTLRGNGSPRRTSNEEICNQNRSNENLFEMPRPKVN